MGQKWPLVDCVATPVQLQYNQPNPFPTPRTDLPPHLQQGALEQEARQQREAAVSKNRRPC